MVCVNSDSAVELKLPIVSAYGLYEQWPGVELKLPIVSAYGLCEQWPGVEPKLPIVSTCSLCEQWLWRGTQAPYCKCLWSVWTVTLPWNSSSLL